MTWLADQERSRQILAEDPYRLDELARLMLLGLLENKNHRDLERGSAIFSRLRVGRWFRAAVQRVRQNEIQLIRLGEVFYLCDPAQEAAALEPIHEVLLRHVATAQSLFQQALPLLLVDLSSNADQISKAVHEIEGVGQILVAGNCRDAELSATLAHELFHTLFRCGNRFLDEGLALHFEARQCPEDCFPLPRREFARVLASSPRLFSLGELLDCEPEQTSHQGGLAGSEAEKQLVYIQAWRLIDDWMTRFGPVATLEACRKLSDASPDRRDETLLAIAGYDSDSAAERLFGRKKTTIALDLDQIAARLASGDGFSDLQEVRDGLRMRIQAGEPKASALLIRLLLTHALAPHASSAVRLAALQEAEPLAARLRQDRADDPEQRLFAAWIATLHCLLASTPDQRWQANQTATRCYREALEQAPEHIDTLNSAGMFFSHLPVQLGGDPAFAQRCFQQAARLRHAAGSAVSTA